MNVAVIRRFTVLFFIIKLVNFSAFAGVSPRDGSIFTQVHIMFECDDIYGADLYEFSIYRLIPSQDSTRSEKTVTVKTAFLACLVTRGLEFGNDYRWYFRAYKKGKLLFTSPWIHFSIRRSAQVMSDTFRTDVRFAGKPGKEVIFLDYSAMAIDKSGKPIWFLPINTDSLTKLVIRDLELTASGTVTHLDISGAYEKDLQGTVLWKAPDDGRVSGGAKEEYHHELKKNTDGSFFVCGSIYKSAKGEIKQSPASSVKYNTLIHYDAGGNILQGWTETGSMLKDSVFRQAHSNNQGGHLNGFAFMPGGKRVFMSFKNLSDVYLYDFISGEFISSIKKPPFSGSYDFQQQHGPWLTAKNQLLIYNNNIAEKEGSEGPAVSHPSVMQFRYDALSQKFALTWQYELRAEKFPGGILGKEGYVSETKAGTILVCAGGTNYAAEVTQNKKKVWECYFYRRTKEDTLWKPYSNYRCQGASSLYPLYYTLQYAGTKSGSYIFRLYNAGSEPGVLELDFSAPGAKKGITHLSKKLQPGGSQVFTVNIENFYIRNGFNCRVTPRHVNHGYKDYFFDKLP
jgi:hypothetical protein